MKIKRILALLVSLCILFSVPVFAETEYATRGEVAEFLLSAADFYNPDVKKSDIIKGYEDGLLHEDWNVTRAEALVMLHRAFGELPKPVGHNKRVSLTAEDFTDIPLWAKSELQNVFDSGIVAGTGKNTFSPNQNVTMEQMELFTQRVYSLYSTNPCDDFYSAANKDFLEKTKLHSGQYVAGTLQSVHEISSEHISDIIGQIVSKEHKYGTPEQKIADLYECFLDAKTINKTSVKPIQEYLDEIDGVKNIGELSIIHERLSKELCVSPFAEISLTIDMEDSTKFMLCFSSFSPFMNKEFYEEDDSAAFSEYKKYMETLLVVSGEEPSVASENAEKYIAFEKLMAESMLSTEEYNDVDKIYNIYKFNKLETLFPDFNFDAELESRNLIRDDRVCVMDVGVTKKFSEMYNQSNIETLKIAAKIVLLNAWGYMLDDRIVMAEENFENALYGTSGHYLKSQLAEELIKNVMPEYLGKIYVEKHFDEKSKQDVTNIVLDIKDVFKERISNLSWMSQETKERAIKKLDAMQINVGYPDRFDSYIDNVDIVPTKKGGTLFCNMLAIALEAKANLGAMQFVQRDRGSWALAPYEVNAGYDPSLNTMTFPAAILQPPIYDKNASYEHNLGAIGGIIAHEMTHAFDSNGALFDENGNKNNWWTESDYKEFEKLCNDVAEFYDGYESAPGIATNGMLTLGENVADMGAASCILELAEKKGNLDYKEIFYAMANTFACTYTKEYAKYLSQSDPHAGDKARINCVVVHLDVFYETFGVKEGDGMYLPPEERITIW